MQYLLFLRFDFSRVESLFITSVLIPNFMPKLQFHCIKADDTGLKISESSHFPNSNPFQEFWPNENVCFISDPSYEIDPAWISTEPFESRETTPVIRPVNPIETEEFWWGSGFIGEMKKSNQGPADGRSNLPFILIFIISNLYILLVFSSTYRRLSFITKSFM